MSEIFRDRSDGAAARREDLLRRRRAELATMPHVVRRVVVARASRITASAVAALAGVVLLALVSSPAATRWAGRLLPDGQPAPLATALAAAWFFGALAWAWSRARGEHRFAVAMSTYVLPSDDVDHDVERLDHERPDREARATAHGLEVRSAAWPVLAAGLVLPATALWIACAVRARGWAVSRFEDALVAHAGALALLAVIGALGAAAATRKAMREPVVAPIAGALAVLCLGGAVPCFLMRAPVAWPLAGVGGTALVLAVIAWRLGRERAQLAITDPAAGSELFTVRGLLRALRGGVRVALTSTRAVLARVRPRTWAILGTGALIASAIGLAVHADGGGSIEWRAPPPGAATAQASPALAPSSPADPSSAADPTPSAPTAPVASAAGDQRVTVVRTGDHVVVAAVLDEQGEARVSLASLIGSVPRGWKATVKVQLGDASVRTVAAGEPLVAIEARHGRGGNTSVELVACKGPRELYVVLRDHAAPGAAVQVALQPYLELADCGPR